MTTSTPFRDLLHAANLRHGTDGFTSPPKEGVLRIFFALKNLTASVGFEPANLGTKGQHATPRPPKPITFTYMKKIYIYTYITHFTTWRVHIPPVLLYTKSWDSVNISAQGFCNLAFLRKFWLSCPQVYFCKFLLIMYVAFVLWS